MKFVIDTNILFSALIKDSVTRALILLPKETFYYPETAMEEVKKYKEFIISKSGLSIKDFDKLFNIIKSRIIIVREEAFRQKIQEANEEIGHIDIKDVMFLATALAVPNDGIWSEDAHFEKQKKVKVWKTKDIIKILEKD